MEEWKPETEQELAQDARELEEAVTKAFEPGGLAQAQLWVLLEAEGRCNSPGGLLDIAAKHDDVRGMQRLLSEPMWRAKRSKCASARSPWEQSALSAAEHSASDCGNWIAKTGPGCALLAQAALARPGCRWTAKSVAGLLSRAARLGTAGLEKDAQAVLDRLYRQAAREGMAGAEAAAALEELGRVPELAAQCQDAARRKLKGLRGEEALAALGAMGAMGMDLAAEAREAAYFYPPQARTEQGLRMETSGWARCCPVWLAAASGRRALAEKILSLGIVPDAGLFPRLIFSDVAGKAEAAVKAAWLNSQAAGRPVLDGAKLDRLREQWEKRGAGKGGSWAPEALARLAQGRIDGAWEEQGAGIESEALHPAWLLAGKKASAEDLEEYLFLGSLAGMPACAGAGQLRLAGWGRGDKKIEALLEKALLSGAAAGAPIDLGAAKKPSGL